MSRSSPPRSRERSPPPPGDSHRRLPHSRSIRRMLEPCLKDCPGPDRRRPRTMTVELMATAEHAPHREEFAALYAQVQQFYAHQMRILDADDDDAADADAVEERWVATFTEDAVVELPLQPPAPLGRHARRPAPARRHPAHPLLRPRPRHTPRRDLQGPVRVRHGGR